MLEFFKEAWKELVIFIYWIFSYLNLNMEVTVAIIILMAIDTLFGLVKSSVLQKKISFKILFAGLAGKVAILILPFLLALVSKHVAPKYDFTPLVDLFLDIMLVSELISIIASTITIRTKKEIKNFDIITKFLKSLRQVFIKYASGLLTKIDGREEEKTED